MVSKCQHLFLAYSFFIFQVLHVSANNLKFLNSDQSAVMQFLLLKLYQIVSSITYNVEKSLK
jgi:hypothetical protein